MVEFKPVVFKLEKELYGLDINRVRGIEKEQEVLDKRIPFKVRYRENFLWSIPFQYGSCIFDFAGIIC